MVISWDATRGHWKSLHYSGPAEDLRGPGSGRSGLPTQAALDWRTAKQLTASEVKELASRAAAILSGTEEEQYRLQETQAHMDRCKREVWGDLSLGEKILQPPIGWAWTEPATLAPGHLRVLDGRGLVRTGARMAGKTEASPCATDMTDQDSFAPRDWKKVDWTQETLVLLTAVSLRRTSRYGDHIVTVRLHRRTKRLEVWDSLPEQSQKNKLLDWNRTARAVARTAARMGYGHLWPPTATWAVEWASCPRQTGGCDCAFHAISTAEALLHNAKRTLPTTIDMPTLRRDYGMRLLWADGLSSGDERASI